MEEIEVPTEHLHEAVHEEAHHSKEKWITGVALSAALLAALAAVSALMSGTYANEAMILRVKASDTWGQFETNSIKLAVLEADADLIKLNNQQVPERFAAKMTKYDGEKKRLEKQATVEQEAYEQRLGRHEKLAQGVTMFQIAIAIAAIAALTKRRWFWYIGLGFGGLGTGFLIYALTCMPVTELKEAEHEPPTKSEKAAQVTRPFGEDRFGNALCGVPALVLPFAAPRNGTEAVPYSGSAISQALAPCPLSPVPS